MDDKWADINELCSRCGEFYGDWMDRTECSYCAEDDWFETWVLMYGNLFVCAICKDCFEDDGQELPELEKYLCPCCRKNLRSGRSTASTQT